MLRRSVIIPYGQYTDADKKLIQSMSNVDFFFVNPRFGRGRIMSWLPPHYTLQQTNQWPLYTDFLFWHSMQIIRNKRGILIVPASMNNKYPELGAIDMTNPNRSMQLYSKGVRYFEK